MKVVADALNGVAYHDDSSIVFASVSKRWGQDGSVTVEIASTMDEVVK
jgi:Holliday junction resolvase RusA-like endonuclease